MSVIINFKLSIPQWLVRILASPLLLCYRLYYGQSARFIYIARLKFAVVDADLYERLRWYNWRLCRSNRTYYAFATAYCGPCRPPKIIWMHRLVYSRSVARSLAESRLPRQTPTPFDVFRSRSVAQQSLASGDGFAQCNGVPLFRAGRRRSKTLSGPRPLAFSSTTVTTMASITASQTSAPPPPPRTSRTRENKNPNPPQNTKALTSSNPPANTAPASPSMAIASSSALSPTNSPPHAPMTPPQKNTLVYSRV
jgi:hypothetical protein